jgi:hypothetical protein
MYFDLQKRMLQPSFSLMRLMPLQQLDLMLRLGLIRRCNVYWWSFWTRYPHLHSHCTCLCTDQVGKMPNTPHWALSGTWQCSPVEYLTVLLQGFRFFSSLVFYCYTSTKKYYFYSVWKGMPVVGPDSLREKVWVSNLAPHHRTLSWRTREASCSFCRTLKTMLHGFMQNLARWKRCARRRSKYVLDRAQ